MQKVDREFLQELQEEGLEIDIDDYDNVMSNCEEEGCG
jgi:hypothetical protein